jgi:hypothetical protein
MMIKEERYSPSSAYLRSYIRSRKALPPETFEF